MPIFEYHVKDQSGKDIKGTQNAPDAASLIASLRSQKFLIVKIEALKEDKVLTVGKGPGGKQAGKSGSINIDDLVVFSRQLATMVGAGIPLIQALDILAEQIEKEKLRLVIRDLHQEVQSGKSFSEAMMKHSKVFSSLFIHMVRAGETSGSLEEILDRVATYLEKSSALQKKVKSALMYPISVTAIAFLITLGMLSFVIPKFADIYRGLNATLPGPTLFLIGVSEVMAQYWIVVIILVIAMFFASRQALRVPSIQLAWDGYILRMPVFGPLLLKVAVSKFTRTFATLVKSGVPILSALEIVAKTSGNKRIEKAIGTLSDSVKKGEGLAGPLEKSGVFPSMVVRMIAIGEETGELEEMLIKIADFYDTQVDAAVSGLTSLIEPLVILFLGVVIGGIVIALFLPIFNLTEAIK